MSDFDNDIRRAKPHFLADMLQMGSETPAAGESTGESSIESGEGAGGRIGPYKLLEQIGEGGYGVVFLAEQEQPIRRRVALKLIKSGMDTRQVVARFEAERQALALMEHPHIAKVLDAGATPAGRPYFVMELVRGVRITDYCDENKLTTWERIRLFSQVCQAMQHAHQKGIIHRDLKPSNILVTAHDGVPAPRVIDFGIAKATAQPLTEKTLFTAFQQFIGTPAYMSPEQAEMGGREIDARSDIYSLGVLLYELLAGRLPFGQETLAKAGLDEVRRVIREQEPPRPSTRLSTLSGADLTTVAARRRVEGPKLVGLLRGDLDWIVMKCLEKDRTRRYATAENLAEDLRRHLAHEPVSAAAPGLAYRTRKFAIRHRAALTQVGAGFLLAAIVGVGFLFFQPPRAGTSGAANTVASAPPDFIVPGFERARVLLNEDFESYVVTGTPSNFPPSWIFTANATNDPINNSLIRAGAGKALQLFGSTQLNWSSVVYHPCTFTANMVCEFRLRLTMSFQKEAAGFSIGMSPVADWHLNGPALVNFDRSSGQIQIGTNYVSGDFAYEGWQRVKIHYQRQGAVVVTKLWLGGVENGTGMSEVDARFPDESSLRYLYLNCRGRVQIDDIKVISAQ